VRGVDARTGADVRPYLAIETSTALGSVALGRGDRVLAEAVVGVSARHSESVLPAVDFVLRAAGVEVSELGGVVVGGGPGSFTGVRVAAATAKGLVRVLGVPLFAYSGLRAVAAGIACGDAAVCALFDARRGEVYAACYRSGGLDPSDVVLAPSVLPIEEVLRTVGGQAAVYAGDGALRYRDAIVEAGGRVAPAHQAVARASALLWLADADPEGGRVADPSDWEPEYLRASGAERSLGG